MLNTTFSLTIGRGNHPYLGYILKSCLHFDSIKDLIALRTRTLLLQFLIFIYAL